MDEARLVGPHRVEMADGTQIEADRIVLATGTESSTPPIEGIETGPYWTNREAIWKPEAVPASLAVIGTGAIGIEFAQIYARFGADVTAIEVLPQILPNEDEDAAASLVPAFEEEGIRLLPGVTIARAEYHGRRWRLDLSDGKPVEARELLVAAGRRPSFDAHDLGAAGVELDGQDRPVLTETLRTTADHIWAAGDATGELLFTHVGTYEAGLVVDERSLSSNRTFAVRTSCPASRACRSVSPTLATSGVIEGRTHGLVKLVADAQTGELLGGHIVGEQADAMIHEVVAVMAGRISAPVVGEAIHAYPTLSEAVKGAFAKLGSV